ncbi:acyl-CoA dehydrogenase family protein [Pseudomaricurvus sp. HS19]|uniref:acyl-CoA dehydrogenase family protein n=1 Tax=Pseudomaricurvus sp. HS19 TaxID=2692626 RepID=UPI00136A0A7C|nr:acyl-CoA dehydrogenase family protein [Pseudomaricurvus sp. HS19]MYM63452.1 acyl-CoA dehydrogenase [Pseudomaricurvus sp. HS19]
MQRKIFEEEHELFRESVRRFLQAEAVPHMDEWREQGAVDRQLFRKAGDNGFLFMWAEEEYGGLGVNDFRYDQVILEEFYNAGCGDIFLTTHNRLVGRYLGNFANDEQKRRFYPGCISGETILGVAMTEPGTGSDLAAMQTRAVDCGDHWLLNGSKTYISNGIIGDLFVVAAKTGERSLGLFLVERGMPGFERGRNLNKLGMKAQDTAELFFDDVRVPKSNVLGEADKGFYYLMQNLAEERLQSAICSLANARAALEETLTFTLERKVFGKPVASFQNSRFQLATMRTETDVAQAFIDRCVQDHNDGHLPAEDAAKAKLYCSELEGRVVDSCLQLHGGAGYMDEYMICRRYGDARISRIYAGTSEIMREIIARSMGLDFRD